MKSVTRVLWMMAVAGCGSTAIPPVANHPDIIVEPAETAQPVATDVAIAVSESAPVPTAVDAGPSEIDASDVSLDPEPTPEPVAGPVTISHWLRRGVVVSDKLAFVLGSADGIDAIKLASGAVAWHSNDALLPLHVRDETLYAVAHQATPLRVIGLHTRDASIVSECGTVELPGWAQVSAVDGLGSHFEVAVSANRGTLQLHWSASTHYVGGVPPSEEQREQSDRQAHGVLLTKLPECNVLSAQQRGREPDPINYGTELPYAGGPFVVGDLRIVIEASEDQVRIKRNSAEADLPVVELASPVGLALVSVDHAHVLIVDPLGSDGAFHSARVFDTATATQLATIAFGPVAPETFVVIGQRVIYATDSELHVIDIARPRRSFTRALRSTAYQGPYPPSTPSGPTNFGDSDMPPWAR